MKKYLTIFALAIILCGCDLNPNAGAIYPDNQPDSIADYRVKFLFEAEGVRVYRFYDQGRYIYFTNTNGRVSYAYTKRAGKATTTHRVETLCNKDTTDKLNEK